MGRVHGEFKFKQTNLRQWPLQKNKLSKVSSTKSGTLMMSISQVLLIKKRPRSSSKIPSVTSDPVTNSPKKLSMKSSELSIRITPVPSRRTRWLFSSSNSSVETELVEGIFNEPTRRFATLASATNLIE